MVDTDDTRRTIHDGRRTTPGVWHKLPTGERIKREIKLFQKITAQSHCKVLERIIFKHTTSSMQTTYLEDISQDLFLEVAQQINWLISQILIYESFEDKKEVSSIFLDISKAFDKVWIRCLLSKLRVNRITGNLQNGSVNT